MIELLQPLFVVRHPGMNSCSLSDDGGTLITGGMTTGGQNTVRRWDCKTGRLVGEVDVGAAVSSCRVSADGKSAVAVAGKDLVCWIDLIGNAVVHRFAGHRGDVNGCALGPGEERVVSGGSDHTVRIWNTRTGAEVSRSRPHARIVLDVAASPDGRWIASSSTDGTVAVWPKGSPREVRRTPVRRHADFDEIVKPTAVLITEAGSLVQVSNDGLLEIRDLETWKITRRFEAHPPGVIHCAATLRGDLIVTCHYAKSILGWSHRTGVPVAKFEGTEGVVGNVAVSNRGGLVAAASIAGCVWKAPEPEV